MYRIFYADAWSINIHYTYSVGVYELTLVRFSPLKRAISVTLPQCALHDYATVTIYPAYGIWLFSSYNR